MILSFQLVLEHDLLLLVFFCFVVYLIGISSRNNLNQIHSIKEKKNEHIKKMESHNSFGFQLRVCYSSM